MLAAALLRIKRMLWMTFCTAAKNSRSMGLLQRATMLLVPRMITFLKLDVPSRIIHTHTQKVAAYSRKVSCRKRLRHRQRGAASGGWLELTRPGVSALLLVQSFPLSLQALHLLPLVSAYTDAQPPFHGRLSMAV